jgi:hypothetical protein
MATSEIEKLERRYAENPHGLTFAPLAEVHRKNGDLARALELLAAGLELHPNYIPASIVLGRCHQDQGDLPAAEAAFAHVLRLDDENVIALKSLADISEQLDRLDDAEKWLRRLVSVDRSNDEAREQLRRLDLARNGRPGSAAVGHPPEVPLKTEAAPEAPASADAATAAEEVSEPPKRPSKEVAALDLPPADIAALDLTDSIAQTSEPIASDAPPEPASAPPIVLEERPGLAEAGAAEIPSITDRPEQPAEPVQPMAGLISQEFQPPEEPVRSPYEVLGIDVETSEEVVLQGSGDSEYRVPNASEDFLTLAEKLTAPRRPEPEPEPEPEPAESAPPASQPATSTAVPAPETPVQPSRTKPYAVQETRGQSVAQFFRAMVAARPPAEPGSPSAAPAVRAAQDGVALGSVPGGDNEPTAPAVHEPEKADADVSFDDFFGSKPEGSGRGGDSRKDDLDQFHSWLQNLKR